MKALSISEPFAMLIALGAKHIETRSFKTNYRGPLAIHASVKFTNEMKALCDRPPFREALRGAGDLPTGYVIATCNLVDCILIPYAKTFYTLNRPGKWLWSLPPDQPEFSFGDYTPGRYAWRLEDVKRLAIPKPARGMLGLWNWGGG